jgi:putative transposase
MPEHTHFILSGLEESCDVWAAMVTFKKRTAYWMARHRRPRWQNNFYDHVIRQGDDLKKQVYYIVNNPVRRALVSNWDDYPYTGSIGIDLRDVLSEILESESPSGRAG